MDTKNQIVSFQVDHDIITPGIYVSRVDGDILTLDLRTRTPNGGDYMDNLTMHSVEHMFATYIRNSDLKDKIIYFGPMGCQTGFYLCLRNSTPEEAYPVILQTLKSIINHTDGMYGATRKECGNFANLSLQAAKEECARYLALLLQKNQTKFEYGE
ncbi:MAG: S-ribosylhomocysteine lyase [Clostridia bacterium]|nr:S-ribosylhomocysteine lyase [Clostridia bacterium]